MKISNTLPQFKNYSTLFVVCGEFAAFLYVANNGNVDLRDTLIMNPRDEAKEKQGYITKTKGSSLGAVSHHENYVEDLKKKFHHKLNGHIQKIIDDATIKEIILFIPEYNSKQLTDDLKIDIKNKIHTIINGEYTKKRPIELVELFNKELIKLNEILVRQKRSRPPILKDEI